MSFWVRDSRDHLLRREWGAHGKACGQGRGWRPQGTGLPRPLALPSREPRSAEPREDVPPFCREGPSTNKHSSGAVALLRGGFILGGGCSRLSMQCKIFVEINSESLAPWWCMASLASYVSGASRGVLRPPPPASPCPVRLSTEPCPQFPKLPSRLTLCLAVPSFGRVRARGRGGSFQALAHRAERSPPRRVMSVMGPSTCSVSPDPALEGSTT